MCKSWDIPFLSLDGVDPKDIAQLVEGMDPKPRVILCTISTVSSVTVQAQIRRLPVKTICLDEVQVFTDRLLLVIMGNRTDGTLYISSKVVNSDEKIGWGGFLPYW